MNNNGEYKIVRRPSSDVQTTGFQVQPGDKK